MIRFRPWLGLLATLGLAASLTYSMMALVLTLTEPRSVAPVPQPTPALTRHLLFVIVDGLRYDVATDPERMPHFAQAMKERSSGEIWAGNFSITSAAVLTYGAGQRGGLEQLARNLNAPPAPFNSWMGNARERGLQIMVVGDVTWPNIFGDHIDEFVVNPDNGWDFSAQTFAHVRRMLAKSPNFLIAHFMTPDRVGHAYGVQSQEYADHIRGVDAELHQLLGEIGDEWAVIVTSDHGALDSGIHSGDTELTRRSPIYAFGRGIAPGVKLPGRTDQVDLAGTMAALLGVPASAHSIGHLFPELLDASDAERQSIVCTDAARALAYGATLVGEHDAEDAAEHVSRCENAPDLATARAEAGSVIAWVNAEHEARHGLRTVRNFVALGANVLFALGLIFLTIGRRWALRAAAPFAVLAAGSTLAVWGTEHLPGGLPTITTLTLIVIGNLVGILVAVFPSRFARLARRAPMWAAFLLPGFAIAAYAGNLVGACLGAALLSALVLLRRGELAPRTPSPFRPTAGVIPFWWWGGLFLLAIPLAPYSVERVLGWAQLHAGMSAWIAAGSAALWAAVHALRHRGGRSAAAHWASMAVLGGIMIAGVWLPGYVPPDLSRAVVVALTLAALLAVFVGPRGWALPLGVAAYAWLGRDFELPILLWSVSLAESVGIAVARRSRSVPAGQPRGAKEPATLAVVLTYAFMGLFLLRIGAQGGLDLTSLDLQAGAFGDPHASVALISVAVTAKVVLLTLLFLGALLSPLEALARSSLAQWILAMFAAHLGILIVHFYACGSSYKIGLRMVQVLPMAIVSMVAAAVLWAALAFISRGASKRASGAELAIESGPLSV